MAEDKEKAAKLKALQLTLDKLDKTYGKGSVMKMGDVPYQDIVWHTHVYVLLEALG